MVKKALSLIICLICFAPIAISKEFAIKIKPVSKITTSNINLQNGDCIDFVVVEDSKTDKNIEFKKGQIVHGTLISREENGFMNETASVYIENLYIKDCSGKRVKLKGVVYKEGRSHDMINGFIPIICIIIRGGEVQIRPEQDVFTIYCEEN